MIGKIIIAASFLLNYGYVESGTNPLTIQGGSNSSITRYNFMVSVHIPGGRICGGSIVNTKLVITAAECVYNIPVQAVLVRYGSLSPNEGGETCGIVNHFEHEYDLFTRLNNIGLILLKKTLIFGPNIGAIALPGIGEFDFALVSAVKALGFGELGDGSRAQILQEANFNIIRSELCEALDSQFCIGYIDGHIKLRNGDDGSPIIRRINNITKLIGIVSSFDHPAGSGFSVIIRVPHYLGLILNITAQYP